MMLSLLIILLAKPLMEQLMQVIELEQLVPHKITGLDLVGIQEELVLEQTMPLNTSGLIIERLFKILVHVIQIM